MLSIGDPAPWFTARSTAAPQLQFEGAAGFYSIVCFFGSAGHPVSRAVLDSFDLARPRLEKLNAGFYGICCDPDDQRLSRLRLDSARMIYVWDFDRSISRLYGAAPTAGPGYVPHTLILDPAMKVRWVIPFHPDQVDHAAMVFDAIDQMPALAARVEFAPVLTVPLVFEPDFCRALIDMHRQNGGRDTGTLSDVGGETVRVHNLQLKSRTDYEVADQSLRASIHDKLRRRVVPEIKRAFQFDATQIERYLVACYDADAGGHFRAHRDDSTRGSAHRRFAITINLNAEDYDGGDLRFPEFGCRLYRSPTGSATVFSCSLMHEVRPVTRGRRYAFLPFMYDEQAARIREANRQFLSTDLQHETR